MNRLTSSLLVTLAAVSRKLEAAKSFFGKLPFSSAEICAKEGAVIDGVGYLHGHMYPSPALAGHLMIAGHHHPLLSLRDEVGCALRSPAYLRAGVNTGALGMAEKNGTDAPTRVLFMPAFNEIAGYDILQIIKNPTSPLSRHILTDDTEIILADGTYIGPLYALIPDESD